MSDFARFQRTVYEWGVETFPNGTYVGAAAHMAEEAQEVYDAARDLNTTVDELAEECADVLLLLVQIAESIGIDLIEEAQRKLEINRKRTWGVMNEQGYVNHVEI